jgi:hypothetical protein
MSKVDILTAYIYSLLKAANAGYHEANIKLVATALLNEDEADTEPERIGGLLDGRTALVGDRVTYYSAATGTIKTKISAIDVAERRITIEDGPALFVDADALHSDIGDDHYYLIWSGGLLVYSYAPF